MQRCGVKNCNNKLDQIYLGHNVCAEHIKKDCDDSKSFNLKKEFNIPTTPTRQNPSINQQRGLFAN
jgi:hypothetical protein